MSFLLSSLNFLNKTSSREDYQNSIDVSLAYTEKELSYNGYESDAFEQVKERCYYSINNANIFGGV